MIKQFQKFFGTNLIAYLIGGASLLVAAAALVVFFSLDNNTDCSPAFAGNGVSDPSGQVIAGTVVEKSTKVSGCRVMDLTIEGNTLPGFVAGETAFNEAIKSPAQSVQVRLEKLPPAYNGLEPGTRLQMLYSQGRPLAIVFPAGPDRSAGLDIGNDRRAENGDQKIVLLILAGLMVLIGIAIPVLARLYPVADSEPGTPKVNKPRRPRFYDPEDFPPG